MATAAHWDEVYGRRRTEDLSWFQARPATSVRLLAGAVPSDGPVLDVGAGASTLSDALVAAGWTDLTLLDVSQEALAEVQARLGDRVQVVVADLLRWQPSREYAAWHDRAVFHFLTDEADRAAYLALATRAVRPGGVLVVGTFAEDGPQSCSGLPTARYDTATLAAHFAPGFTLLHAEREEHRTPAGVVQPFTWVVLRRTGSPT